MSKSEILLTFPFCKRCSRVWSTEKNPFRLYYNWEPNPQSNPPNLSFKFPQKKGVARHRAFFQNFPSMCLGAELMPGSGIAFKNVALIIAEGFRLDFGMPKNHMDLPREFWSNQNTVVLMDLRIFIWDFEIEIKRFFFHADIIEDLHLTGPPTKIVRSSLNRAEAERRRRW